MIIVSATLDGMVGTLEEGKFADLVVVDGDPLTDMTVLQHHDRITAVVEDGGLYRGLTDAYPYLADQSAIPAAQDPAMV